ncbi:MAG: hypothetical protein RSF88_01850 [Lachnospiraceae bacterium]
MRGYKTVRGAVCLETGEGFYEVCDGRNKQNMSLFLKNYSKNS